MSEAPKPTHFEGWEGPLLPYRAFHEHYSRGFGWHEKIAYVVPCSLQERVRIVFERATSPETGISGNPLYFDLGRSDTLAENGIWDADEDAKDFAEHLFETLFLHTSPHEMQAVVDRLQAYIAEFERSCAELAKGQPA